MNYIDLHTHSNASDGTFTPKELIVYAKEKSLRAIALTDHDTISGLSEAIDAASKHQIELIPGIELAAEYGKEEIHILGYYYDYTNSNFLKKIEFVQKARNDRNLKMIKKLQNLGFHVTLEELTQVAEADDIITRAHYGRLLLEKGYVKTMQEAFEKYIGAGGPGYVRREILTPKDSIEMIRNAGGIAVLAHPTLYKLSSSELDSLVKDLTSYGLEGIEAIYSLYSRQDESNMRTLAHKYTLLITGGSDFHGTNKPNIDLGVGRGNLKIPYEILEDIKQKILSN